jgi:predicted ATP-dependent endonuclease of OLD family
MKIQSIEINNYKAFHGKYTIKVGGKNLFIYGENGSGKSSLYYALKDFFQASIEDIDLNELENIFLPDSKKGNAGIPCKILFLDDVFIGLDIANRLPLLEILKSEFPDYQIFITTYDKPWFEYAKTYLENAAGSEWKTLEFYAQQTKEGYEIPCVFDNQDLVSKAEVHLGGSDYKAAAVYTRSAFEKIIRDYCEKKKKKIVFRSKLKDYTTENFWDEIKDDVQPTTKTDIERYRSLVLNSFSHYNTEKHEIGRELTSAIQAIKTLKLELSSP